MCCQLSKIDNRISRWSLVLGSHCIGTSLPNMNFFERIILKINFPFLRAPFGFHDILRQACLVSRSSLLQVCFPISLEGMLPCSGMVSCLPFPVAWTGTFYNLTQTLLPFQRPFHITPLFEATLSTELVLFSIMNFMTSSAELISSSLSSCVAWANLCSIWALVSLWIYVLFENLNEMLKERNIQK